MGNIQSNDLEEIKNFRIAIVSVDSPDKFTLSCGEIDSLLRWWLMADSPDGCRWLFGELAKVFNEWNTIVDSGLSAREAALLGRASIEMKASWKDFLDGKEQIARRS